MRTTSPEVSTEVNNHNVRVTVLVVDCNEITQDFYRQEIKGSILISAYSLAQARVALEEAVCGKRSIDFVVVSACMESPTDLLELTREFRGKLRSTPFIGASNSPEYAELLLEAGCGYVTPKEYLPQMIREFLGSR